MMRTKTALFSALLLIAAPAAAAPLTDYVDNGGFEAFEDNAPVDWRVLDGNAEQTADAAEGDSALVLLVPGDVLRSAVAQNISLEEGEDPPTPSGTTYEFSFSADLSTGADTPSTSEVDADGVVFWKDAQGNVVGEDRIHLTVSQGYVEHSEVLQAPLPAAGDLPVTEAEVQFSLERLDLTDRTDANLKVDAVSFGPATPSLVTPQ